MSRGLLLFKDIDTPGLTGIETYRKLGGYESLWERTSSEGFASLLRGVFRWRRHVPGAR